MPAKAVCFDSLEKYDGTGFRYLQSKEYFQLAGRAGRRGLDEVGYSICVMETKFANVNKIQHLIFEERNDLKSQFALTYNTVINLLYRYSEEERQKILQSSFYTYQTGHKQEEEIQRSFQNKVSYLEKHGYIEDGLSRRELTNKGLFAMNIYHHEILFSEVFATDIGESLSDVEVLLVVATILYEERRNRSFKTERNTISDNLYKKLMSNPFTRKYFKENKPHPLETFMVKWYEGSDFLDLIEYTTMSEGDIIRFFRLILDSLNQLRHASLNEDIKRQVRRIEHKIDRDVVSVSL